MHTGSDIRGTTKNLSNLTQKYTDTLEEKHPEIDTKPKEPTEAEKKQAERETRIKKISKQLEADTKAEAERNGRDYEPPVPASEWLIQTNKQKIDLLNQYIEEKEELLHALARVRKDTVTGHLKATERQRDITQHIMGKFDLLSRRLGDRAGRAFLTKEIVETDGKVKRAKHELETIAKDVEDLEKNDQQPDNIKKKLITESQLETIGDDMGNDSTMPSEQFVEKYSFLDNYIGVQSVDPQVKNLFDFLKSTLEAEREQLPKKQELTETQKVINFFIPEPVNDRRKVEDKDHEMNLDQERIEGSVEKAEFESNKRKLIQRKQEMIDDSTVLSLDAFKKKHSSMMFMVYGNEELQAYVMECRAYTKATEEMKAKEAQKGKKRSHEEVDGATVSKPKQPKGQDATNDEIVHVLAVKKSEIKAIEQYVEIVESELKDLDLSDLKKDKLVMDTHLETMFDPTGTGIEVCTMLRTQSKAEPMDWDHGDIPIEDLIIDDGASSIYSYEDDEQREEALSAVLSAQLEDMKNEYDLAKQQYSELSTKHTHVINELEKVRDGMSLAKWKFKKESEKQEAKYEALGRRIQFYGEGIERLGGSFQQHSIKAGVYEEIIADKNVQFEKLLSQSKELEAQINVMEFETQQYIAETEELNFQIEELEADLEQQGKNYNQLLETNRKLWKAAEESDSTVNELEREKDFLAKEEDKRLIKLNEYERKLGEYEVIMHDSQKVLDRGVLLRDQLVDQLKVSNDAISELLAEKGDGNEVIRKMFEHKNVEIHELTSKNSELVCQIEDQRTEIAELDKKSKSLDISLKCLDQMLGVMKAAMDMGTKQNEGLIQSNKGLLENNQGLEYHLERAMSKMEKEQDEKIELEEQLTIVEDCLEESGARYLNSIRVKAIESNDQAIADLGLYNEMLLEQTQELKKQVKIRGDIPEDKEGVIKNINDLKHELSVLVERMISSQIKLTQIEKQEDMEEGVDQPDGACYRGSRIVQIDNVVLHTCVDNRNENPDLDTHVHGCVGAITTLVDIAGRSGAKGMASMILEFDVPDSSNIPGVN